MGYDNEDFEDELRFGNVHLMFSCQENKITNILIYQDLNRIELEIDESKIQDLIDVLEKFKEGCNGN